MHEKLILVHSNFQTPFFLDYTLKLKIFDDYAVLESLNRYFLKKNKRKEHAFRGLDQRDDEIQDLPDYRRTGAERHIKRSEGSG